MVKAMMMATIRDHDRKLHALAHPPESQRRRGFQAIIIANRNSLERS